MLCDILDAVKNLAKVLTREVLCDGLLFITKIKPEEAHSPDFVFYKGIKTLKFVVL